MEMQIFSPTPNKLSGIKMFRKAKDKDKESPR
jgi:hypothetical protein